MAQQLTFEPRAILVADMVGYSRWLAHQPAATQMAFTSHVRHVFQPAVRAHGGVLVKTTGDGIVAIFRYAGDAERSAREIQSRLEAPAIDITPDVDLTYRIAVHYGNIMVRPDDIFGIDVNAAMHMQALAPPGGICISKPLFARLSEEIKASYRYAGRKYVKNIPDPVEVYLHYQEPGSLRQHLRSGQPPLLRRRTLSPLPRLGIAELRVHARHQSQRVVGTFAQDALMEALSRFRDLLVVTPIGVEIDQHSSQTGKLREYLARELTLEYFIHGSCLVGNGGTALFIHFEYLPRRQLIFSSKIIIDGTDLSSIGSRISSECVVPIILHLRRNEAESWDALRTSPDEQAFRESQKLMTQRTVGALDQARRLLAGILERSGEIGNVYVALARAEHDHGQLLAGEQFVESLEKARIYAQKAIELDDLNARAHGELAQQALFLRKHATAVEEYQQALRLNPYDPFLLADWADCLTHTGRAEEALPILESLSASWPSDKAFVEWNLCDAAWAMNRPERIVELLRDKPDLPHVHRYLTASYAKLGRMSDARRHAEKVLTHQPNFSAKAWREVVPHANRDAAEEYADFLSSAGL